MFETEIEMERRSSILPMLLMVSLLVGILGVAIYVILQVRGKTPLSTQDATKIVTAALQGPGPAVIHFRTGLVNNGEKLPDPNYRLLEKAGIVKLAKAPKGGVLVSVTPEGEQLLSGLPGFKKSTEADGAFSYQAALAQRQFISIAGVTMSGPDTAIVEYNWKWVPNALGDVFDASGAMVKSFTLWERQTLINKYAVAFYHGDPTRSTLAVERNGKEWKLPAR